MSNNSVNEHDFFSVESDKLFCLCFEIYCGWKEKRTEDEIKVFSQIDVLAFCEAER